MFRVQVAPTTQEAASVKRKDHEQKMEAGCFVALPISKMTKPMEPRVDWRVGLAESLPFPSDTFDAVVSQFGLMFFPDRRQALREMLRVLAPGGRLVVAVWDSLDHIPAYAAEVALLERTAGRIAAEALSAPFVMGNREALNALFKPRRGSKEAVWTLYSLSKCR
jgi:ubiquinone/menaquinone biosynthesis C-methylase UbiE